MSPVREQQPRVSIIIPVYNTVRYLGECLDSLLAQTEQSWECLAVDDGSTDGSGELLDAYAAKDARIRVIHRPNAGPSAARNEALDVACGEWVIMMDSDDAWEPGLLEKALHCAEESGVDMVQVGIQTYRNGMPESLWLPFGKNGCHVLPVDKRYLRNTTSYNWDKLIRRALLERYHIRYDASLRYSEDLPVLTQFCAATERVGIVGEPLYRLRLHESSATAKFYAGGHPVSYYRNMLDSVLRSAESLVSGSFTPARVAALYPALLSWFKGRVRDTRHFMPDNIAFDVNAYARNGLGKMLALAPLRHKLRFLAALSRGV